jgi:DNA-binding PadR family transcriptional regulator
MARGSKSKYAVLGILTIAPSSGYDLKKFTENNLSHFWSESYGNLYTLLKRLLEQGLVTKQTQRQEGKPDRIVYSITDKGREEFEQWLALPAEPESIRSELLLKLFFGNRMPRERVTAHLLAFRRQQEGLDAALAGVERVLEAQRHHPDYPFWLMTLRRGRLVCQARLRWVDESLALLGDAGPDGDNKDTGAEG